MSDGAEQVYAPPRRDPAPAGMLRMPEDCGLAALGLVALLWATVEIVSALMTGTLALGMGPATSWGPLVIAGAGVVRAVFHLRLALALRRVGPQIRGRATAFALAAVVTAFIAVGVTAFDEPQRASALPMVLIDWIAWPVLLVAVLARPRFRTATRSPGGGVEGIGVMMIALGLLAASVATTGLLGSAADHSRVEVFGPGAEYLNVGFGAFFVRGIVYAGLGVACLRSAAVATFRHRAGRMLQVHVVTLCFMAVPIGLTTLGAFDAGWTAPHADRQGVALMITLAACTGALLLTVWPALLFGHARALALATPAQEQTSAPRDGALVALGWLLCLYVAATVGPAGALGASGSLRAPGFEHGELPPGLPLLSIAAALWAGLELIALTRRARAAAIVYSVVAFGIAFAGIGTALLDEHAQAVARSLVTTERLLDGGGVIATFVLPAVALGLALRRRGP